MSVLPPSPRSSAVAIVVGREDGTQRAELARGGAGANLDRLLTVQRSSSSYLTRAASTPYLLVGVPGRRCARCSSYLLPLSYLLSLISYLLSLMSLWSLVSGLWSLISDLLVLLCLVGFVACGND